MKKFILYAFALLLLGCESPMVKGPDYPILPVDIKNVELTDNFWLPKIKTIQEATISFAFEKSDNEGRMENFLIAGGIMEGETRGLMPFDDTDVYKIIEGASYSLISAPDENLDVYLDSIIAIVAKGQEDDGYLTTWKTINHEKSPAHWCPPGGRWENLHCSHELYNSGHLFEAAAAHYAATGKRNFLDVALKNADLLVSVFGSGKNETPPGHQIVETGLIKLYRITNNKNYLELAKFFLDARGQAKNRELYGTYSQDHVPVTQQDEVVGHAVRAVYMYAGMTDIAAIYNDSDYLQSVQKLWENMVYKKMYITGGIGALHQGEAFGENYELPNLTAYSETCAAIGSVYWNHRLFMLTGESKYYDVLERTLYNGLISGISLDGKQFFYPNALESDGRYKFNMGSCTRQSWFDCSCCPTNLIRFIPSLPSLIYAQKDNDLYVNLFVANRTQVDIGSTKVEVSQETNYPWSGNVKILVNPEKSPTFTLKIRIPGWANNQVAPGDLYSYLDTMEEAVVFRVNGKDVEPVIENGYASISRKWKKNDEVEIILPMTVRRVVSHENIKTNKNMVSLEQGPIVFCAEGIGNPGLGETILADDIIISTEWRPALLNGINVLTGNLPDGAIFTAVPYYSWSNRGVGAMKVWLPRTDEKEVMQVQTEMQE